MSQNLIKILFPTIFFSFLFLIPSIAAAQEPVWLTKLKQQKWMDKVSRLELLKTSRVEAETILGKSDEDYVNRSIFVRYEIRNGDIRLDYTDSQCTSVDGVVALGTVSSISFDPNEKVLFSSLRLPLKQFKYSHSSDTPLEFYENEETGVTVSVMGDKVKSIDFSIPARKNFSCVTVSSFIQVLDNIKSLKLLETNRDQVNDKFPQYQKLEISGDSPYTEFYFTGDARIRFFYSKGKCEFDAFEGYKTAEWVLEGVKISPVNSIKPEEFGINIADFKKEKKFQNGGNLYIYYNNESGISFEMSDGTLDDINFYPPPHFNSLMCDQERAKTNSSAPGLFPEKIEDRIFIETPHAYVEKLNIDRSEIIADDLSNQKQANSSSDSVMFVNVSTRAVNPLNDVLTYNYTVNGGKIIGSGAKVIWDLTGVKAGTYQISSGVDDGCGVCGPVKTRTIIVRESSK